MPREIDESLIEATIRRIAETQAARETEPDVPATAGAELPTTGQNAAPMPETVSERPERLLPGDSAGFRRALSGDGPEPRPAARGLLRSVPNIEMPAVDAVAPPRLGVSRDQPDAPDGDGPLASVLGRLEELARQLDAVNRRVEALAASVDAITAGSAGDARQPLRLSNAGGPGSRAGGPAEPPEQQVIDRRPIPRPLPPLEVEPKRGLDLLPLTYRVTVEDKRRGVDLVPLHRALLSVAGVRDMALISYNNGAAIVSLETTGELDPDTLAAAVSRAMSRGARAEVHSDHAFVVKLAED